MYNPKAIKVLMAARDIKVQDLAKASGKSEVTIRSVLRGEDTKVSTLEAVANALGVEEAVFYLPLPEGIPSIPTPPAA